MGDTARLRWQRQKMWEYDPRCYYCRTPTVLPERVEGAKVNGSPKVVPPNMATIDHLRPRHHPGRHEPTNGREFRRVLACFKCNNERDRLEHEAMPREKLWEMCGTLPLSMQPLEELRRVEAHLMEKNPARASDRRSIDRSLAAIREVISAKGDEPK